MASKRIVQSAINWGGLSERVPTHQRAQFLAFKAKSDGYLKRVLQNPENPPAIDWSFYKSRVPIAGLVDKFEKEYKALTIPYPADTVSSQLDSLDKEIKSDIAKFKSESDARIAQYKKELQHLSSLLAYDQMTMEDFRDAFPDQALDPINKPSYWPHDAAEQPGYEGDKDLPTSSH